MKSVSGAAEALSPCHRDRVRYVTDIPDDEPPAVYCPSCGQAWPVDDSRLIQPR